MTRGQVSMSSMLRDTLYRLPRAEGFNCCSAAATAAHGN